MTRVGLAQLQEKSVFAVTLKHRDWVSSYGTSSTQTICHREQKSVTKFRKKSVGMHWRMTEVQGL